MTSFTSWALLAVLALASVACATVSSVDSSRVVMERDLVQLRAERGLSNGWVVGERAPADELIELTFAVKQQNLELLHDTLMQVSNPRSSRYGKHLTRAELSMMVHPKASSVAAVFRFLRSHGVSAKTINIIGTGEFITAVVPVPVAEEILNTTYHVFEHVESGKTAVRVHGSYSLPANVAEHVDFVAPTMRLPVIRSVKIRKVADPQSAMVSPTALRDLYNASTYTGQVPTNVQAVASFLEQYYSPNDLQEFFSLFQPASKGRTVQQDVGDPNNPSSPGTEASLDVQYVMSVGDNVTTWVYYTAGRAPNNPNNEPFLKWLTNVTSSAQIPNLFTVSYGDDEKSVGLDYGSRVNVEFQKLGTLGVSILFASGDDGVGGNCTLAGRFSPDFPSGSPYVTAVGGLVGGIAGRIPTGEATDSISGGGFSDYWARPDWQDAAVTAYLSNTTGLPNFDKFNQSGRGYPDLAAQSEMFTVVQFGIPLPGVGGTSCAAPTTSGIFSLLNDLRLRNGKSPLGFLNPLIYQIGAENENAFNDVTEGANEGCGAFETGFPARKGWDPATGFGSPNFGILSGIVLSLP